MNSSSPLVANKNILPVKRKVHAGYFFNMLFLTFTFFAFFSLPFFTLFFELLITLTLLCRLLGRVERIDQLLYLVGGEVFTDIAGLVCSKKIKYRQLFFSIFRITHAITSFRLIICFKIVYPCMFDYWDKDSVLRTIFVYQSENCFITDSHKPMTSSALTPSRDS